MAVKVVNGVEFYDDSGLSPDIPKTNQHFISASRQIREMIANGELYKRHMEGLDQIDDDDSEAEDESQYKESPFTANRSRVDDEIIEVQEQVEKVKAHVKKHLKKDDTANSGSSGGSTVSDSVDDKVADKDSAAAVTVKEDS